MYYLRDLSHGYLDQLCYSYKNESCIAHINVAEKMAVGVLALPLIAIIHELGHAFAAHLLYKNADPKITLIKYGFNGAYCTISPDSYSKLGNWLGITNSSAIFSAAGPFIQVTSALALSYFFPRNGLSCLSLAWNGAYAFSALETKEFYKNDIHDSKQTGHDFVDIKISKGAVIGGAVIITSLAIAILEIQAQIYDFRS